MEIENFEITLINDKPNSENMSTTIMTVQISEGVDLKIYPNGAQEWYKEGKLYREGDQPAVIYADGMKEWYKDGKLHRDNDQPAIIWADGTKFWYKEGKLHRDNDQPALIYAIGTKEWYKEGMRHRDNDRPAIIEANGEKFWFKDGVKYTPQIKVVEEKKSQNESPLEENKRLKEEVTNLKKVIIELVSR